MGCAIKKQGKNMCAFWPSHSSFGILQGRRSHPFGQTFVSVVTDGPWRRAGWGNSGMKALRTLGRVLIWGMLKYTSEHRSGVASRCLTRRVVEKGLPEKAECGCGRPGGSIILHSHQHLLGVPGAPQTHQSLVFVNLLHCRASDC